MILHSEEMLRHTKKCIFATDMEKEKLIKAIQQKGLSNSLISLYYNIGRALPFTAQRFPDGRVSDWYYSQHVEVHQVKPSGKGGRYGSAYGFYFRNGERANAWEDSEASWCKIDDKTPQEIPCAACGSWVLLDILGEPTVEPVKIYGINDILEKGKHQGEMLADVIHNDWGWVKWANEHSSHFFFDVDAVAEERKNNIKVLNLDDTINFGKYKGETIKQIAEKDMRYLIWLAENSEDFIVSLEGLEIKP